MSKKNRTLLFSSLAILVCVFAVSVTFAWFTDHDDTQNRIQMGKLQIDVIEKSDDGDAVFTDEGIKYTSPVVIGEPKSKIVDIENVESLDVYLRVTVKKVWMDKEGTVLDDKDPDKIKLIGIDEEKWLYQDANEKGVAYYYLRSPLLSGDTVNLFNSFIIENTFSSNEEALTYSDLKSRIIITANAVQADDGEAAVAEQNWPSIIVKDGKLVLKD